MTRYETSWVEAPDILPEDSGKPCRQVYVWIITTDQHVIIVSKDGSKWQLPGGKPEPSETLIETAIREVREETSLDIGELSDNLQFFGYQIVKDVESEESPYLQIRYLLKLDTKALNLEFGVQNEDTEQAEEDIIKFVKAVSIHELVERIPWMVNSPEFDSVKALIAP